MAKEATLFVWIAALCIFDSGNTVCSAQSLKIEKVLEKRISESELSAIGLSPSGGQLAIGDAVGNLILVDTQSLVTEKQVKVDPAASLSSICFISEVAIAACDKNGEVHIKSALGLNALTESLPVTAIKFVEVAGSSENRVVVFAKHDSILIRDSEEISYKIPVKFPHEIAISDLAEDQLAVVGAWAPCLLVFDIANGEKLEAFQLRELAGEENLPEYVVGLSFDPFTGHFVVLCANDYRIWVAVVSIAQKKVVKVLEKSSRGPLVGIEVLPGGVVCAYGHDVLFWDIESGNEIGKINHPKTATGPANPFFTDLCILPSDNPRVITVFLSTTDGTLEKYTLSN